MRSMHLQPVMNGKLRIAVPKEKVNGWKHTSAYGIHIFTRGHIGYILTPDDEKVQCLKSSTTSITQILGRLRLRHGVQKIL